MSPAARTSDALRRLKRLVAAVPWRPGPASVVRAISGPDGSQEAHILVQGRYRPGTVRVAEGIPVRLRFHRLEDDPCSERVIFSGLNLDRRLAAFQETTVEFTPRQPGVFLFTCQWGMYRGQLIVEQR